MSAKSAKKVGSRHGRQLVSPQDLAQRWACSPTTVRRLATRAGLARVHLGDGANGTVRYVLSEIEAYEDARSTKV